MPNATVNGVNLYYEEHGQGPPLVMVQGLGYSSRFWYKQIPELEKSFRLIVYDNRDVGKSEKVDENYEIKDMAEDCKGIIDHLGLQDVHLLGLSLGGYIAQQFALSYPEVVDKLVLVSTHYGGPEYLQATGDLWKEILDVEGLSLGEVYRKGFKYSVAEDFFTDEEDQIEKLVKMRVDEAQPPDAFQRQFQAGSNFDLQQKVKGIQAETLVLAGNQDRVVPPEFAEKLCDTIPSCELKTVDGSGHLIHLEKPAKLNSLILDFLGEDDV